MPTAYLNRVFTVVPRHEIHGTFVRYARSKLADNRRRSLFEHMVARCGIAQRWSCLEPAAEPEKDSIDSAGFYRSGMFASTAERMGRYAAEAPELAARAVDGLQLKQTRRAVTHLIYVTCTGFSAPGTDLEMVRRCGLEPSVERTLVGFMGCQGTFNALKLARHIVRSEPTARVLLLSIELCTLHLQEADDFDRILPFLLFGDGCGAALVTAEPTGFALDRFQADVAHEAREQITWNIGDSGFDMYLSRRVPVAIRNNLHRTIEPLLNGERLGAIDHWAVHPGGRAILDAAGIALGLDDTKLDTSREVLFHYGNMSSSSILFVLQGLMARARSGERGCALAFGPGLSTEAMLFHAAR